MATSRRAFLRATMITSAGATLCRLEPAAAGTTNSPLDRKPQLPSHIASTGNFASPVPVYLRQETYVKLLNTKFQVCPSGAPAVTVRLIKVSGQKPSVDPSRPAKSRRQGVAESFSLQWLAPAGTSLPQKTYTLKHPEIGTFALFLVPFSPQRSTSNSGVRYHAVINRL